MTECNIAGMRLIVVCPGVYRVPGKTIYLSYVEGWWVTKGYKPTHSKPWSSMTEAIRILKATLESGVEL